MPKTTQKQLDEAMRAIVEAEQYQEALMKRVSVRAYLRNAVKLMELNEAWDALAAKL